MMAQQQYQNVAIQQQQTQPSVAISQPPPVKTNLKFPPKTMKALAITQIVCGILSIVFGIASVCLAYYEFGPAIWCAVPYCISGSLGVPAAKTRKRGLIIAYMVMSIISTVFCSVPFVTYIAYMASGNAHERVIVEYGYAYDEDYLYHDIGWYGYGYSYYAPSPAKFAVFSIVVLLTLVEAIVAIIAAAYCCRAVCCCQNGGGSRQMVYYFSNTGLGQPMPVTGLSSLPIQTHQTGKMVPGLNGIPVQYVPAYSMQTVAAAGGPYPTPGAIAAAPANPPIWKYSETVACRIYGGDAE